MFQEILDRLCEVQNSIEFLFFIKLSAETPPFWPTHKFKLVKRMFSIVLSGFDGCSFLYVDEIIVFGCSLNHHNEHLDLDSLTWSFNKF